MSDLHPALAADCHLLLTLPECAILLHKNAEFRWLIVVPDTGVEDFLDLSPPEQHRLLAVCATLSVWLKGSLGLPKVNFAAIGNVVPQMHLHVVGRHPGDPCWPQVVWGRAVTAVGYEAAELARLRAAVAACFERPERPEASPPPACE